MKIYEIEEQLDKLFWELENSDEEFTIEQFNQLKDLQLERKQKFEGIANHIINLRYQADALKSESKRLADKAKSFERRREGYEQFLQHALPEGGTFGQRQVKWRNNPPSVEITGEVPEQYLRQKIIFEADKAEIKKDLQCGATFDFAKIVQKKRLVIE